MNKTLISILKVLNKSRESITGSREISRQLTMHGVNLTERTVRYHLKILDERGLTEPFGKEGRKITDKGRDELSKALVTEKLGFVNSRIDTLSYLTDFDLQELKGNVILNISYIPKKTFREALNLMKPVFSSPYVINDGLVVAREGEKVGDITVPAGKVAIGTLCSVTINGIFLKAGLPVVSRFGGVLEIEKRKPTRFVALISYEGSSLDPLEIFIRGKMTDVKSAVKNGTGRILASFREIPVVCYEKAKELSDKLKAAGIGGILTIGEPNVPLFEMPVGMDRAGMVVVGGLNPISILEEKGISTESKAMSTLYDFSMLKRFKDIYKSAVR